MRLTKVINLRQIRKQRGRDAKRAVGDANAARHGEAPALREAREAEAHRARARHEDHRREEDPRDD